MTIKEIEERTGMDRANIRFYEKEGLLTPERLANGYRDYTEQDAETLLRIKLLRSLHVPLEDIRALQRGEKTLTDAMYAHLHTLEAEASAVAAAESVCRAMQEDHADYSTLDAGKYLTQLQNEPRTQQTRYLTVPKEDTAPHPAHPWRRYFARSLDYNLCILPWELLFYLVFHVNPNTNLGTLTNLLSAVLAYLVMLFIEPLLLRLFGTTPGKWIFGLRLTNIDGSLLTYEEGLQRTWNVIRFGYGFDIPGYSLYRLWKSYHQCVRGDELIWDESPLRRLYTIRDTKLWRSIAWFAASTAFALIVSGAAAFPALPPNRGELTVAQFAENFNYLRDYYDPGPLGSEYNYTLAENGEWQAKTAAGDAYIYVSDIPNRRDPIPFVYYTDADGSLTGFSISNENGEYWELMDLSDFQFAALAMITAQPECGLFSNPAQTVAGRLGNLTDTDFTVAGVHVTLEYEFADETVSYNFTVTKEQ